MVFEIENSIYLETDDLAKYGLKKSLVKKWTNHHKAKRSTGKPSDFWVTIPHPDHGRKILVKYSSIPFDYMQKHKLPTEEDIKLENALKKSETQNTIQLNEISLIDELKEHYNKKHIEFYPTYYKRFLGNKKKAVRYAREHAVFEYLLEIYTNGNSEALKTAFKAYLNLPLEAKIINFRAFKRKLSRLETEGIEIALINKLNGRKGNRTKTSLFHIGIIEKLYSDPHQYKLPQIHKSLVDACITNQKTPPSLSWVKKYFAQYEVKNRLCEFRNGLKKYNDTVSTYLPRQKSLYAGDLYMMDGTPTQFQCLSDKGNIIRLNLYVVIDAYSGKITGFDLSLSEDRHAVINSLKHSFNLHSHLPAEILHDNFSATKTDEFKSLADKLTTLGVKLRAAKVGNAQDKANVERFFSTFQTKYCSLIDGYIGEGITSKRKEARANPEFLKSYYDNGLPNINEMKIRLIELINIYNVCENSDGISPAKLYQLSNKPNVKEIDKAQVSLMFWKEKVVKITRSMVKITVKKVEHTFEIYDNELKNQLNGRTVKCRYDELDMSSIYLFDAENDLIICECHANFKPHQAQVNQTDDDVQAFLKYDAKKKSHRLHNHKKTEDIQKAASEEIGVEKLFVETPYSVYKKEANQSEYNELNQLMRMHDIDFSKVGKYQEIDTDPRFITKQKSTIGQELNRKIYTDKASLKPYKPNEEEEQD